MGNLILCIRKSWAWTGVLLLLTFAAIGWAWAQRDQKSPLTDDFYAQLTPEDRMALAEDITRSFKRRENRFNSEEIQIVLRNVFNDASAAGQPEIGLAIMKEISDSAQDVELRAVAFKEMGEVHRERQDYTLARSLFEQALELTADRRLKADIQYQIAEDDCGQGQYRTALHSYLDFLSYTAGDAEERERLVLFVLFENIRQLLEKCTEEDGAAAVVEDFDAYVEGLKQDNAGSHPPLDLAMAAKSLKFEEFDRALEIAGAIDDPDWLLCASLMKVSVLLRMGRFDDAVEILDETIQEPGNENAVTRYTGIEACNLIGESKSHGSVALGEWWVASSIWNDPERLQKVSKHVPPYVLVNYGTALGYVGRAEEGVPFYRMGWEFNPECRWGRQCGVILGLSLVQRGDIAEGRAILERIYGQCSRAEVRAQAANALAELRIAEGDRGAAAELIAETLSQVEREVENRSVKYTKQQAHYLADRMAGQ